MRNIISLIGAGLIGGLIVVGAMKAVDKNVNVSPKTSLAKYVNNETIVPAGSIDLSQAAALASPSVVYVQVSESKESAYKRSQEEDNAFSYFGYNAMPQKGTGSGVIISDDGYIVTNNHVVSLGENDQIITDVKVTLSDNREFKAKVVGRDKITDLAVLKIDATGLPNIQKGNSDNLRIGEWVLAIGYPYNIGTTVTAGIVSAKNRKFNDEMESRSNKIQDFIQTDAAVNPGNSGGALIDAQGRLIGINSAIETHTGSFEGYSFAIPINLVSHVVEDLIKKGKVERPVLGIEMVTDNEFPRAVKELDLNVSQGVIVNRVIDGKAAQFAGILPNDVIIKIDDSAVRNVNDVRARLAKSRAGDVLKVTVFRGGQTRELQVTLSAS